MNDRKLIDEIKKLTNQKDMIGGFPLVITEENTVSR